MRYLTNLHFTECDATAIATAVVQSFQTKNVSLSKVITLTTDGAAVML
jgi:hypothetical protein